MKTTSPTLSGITLVAYVLYSDSGDNILPLLGMRMPMDVVLRAGLQHGSADHGFHRPDGVGGDEPAYLHVDPSFLRTKSTVRSDVERRHLVARFFSCRHCSDLSWLLVIWLVGGLGIYDLPSREFPD
jgi:hypothetical protein